ncbi:hypothetical protein [Microbacterium sp.]|uniref:hypothetical protein n=1 Tax=Microbacterium sp. TaxID=51671 RepID=UPI0035B244B6
MGFGEDVERFRLERAEAESREGNEARAFNAELEELWRDAHEYWSSKTKRFTADEVGWILHGNRYAPVGGDELVSLPVFPQRVVKGARTRTDFDRGYAPETISAPGFVVLDGIAICDPGQLRPMAPRIDLGMARQHAEQVFRTGGFFDLPIHELPKPSPFAESAHQVAFAEFTTGTHVIFGRVAESLIEAYVLAPSASGARGWAHKGTLRNLVAGALADAIDKHG